MSNIIDRCDGDVDMAKLNKYAQKKGWFDEPEQPPHWDKRAGDPNAGYGAAPQQNFRMNEPEGFKSGLRQFNEDLKKQGKKANFDNNGGGRYGGGGNNRDYYAQQRNEVEEWYGARKKEEDGRSATEKLFDNTGTKAGLSGRGRRFVPPSKDNGGGGTGGNAGFHPGRSV